MTITFVRRDARAAGSVALAPAPFRSAVPRVSGATSRLALLGLLGTALSACTSPPDLDAVEPATGYPRQLLGVDGDTLFAEVVWDAGLPSETSIYNGLFGTNYFQIPVTSSSGSHPVALRNSNGTSGTVNVTVLAPSGAFPAPRIEDVGLLAVSSGSPPDVLLTVAAANLDTDAALAMAGFDNPTCVRWGGLPLDYLQEHVPATFGYPVYHYVQLLCVVEGVSFGTTLNITVTNTDGQTAGRSYALPANLAQLDSDGDGLLDSWEVGGYTAPSGGTVDLPSMGADKLRKTIPVEVDWVAVATPNAAIWATIEAAFRDAPVLNPIGSRGIDVLIDRGQGGEFIDGGDVLAAHTTMDFGANPTPGYVDFFNYKSNNFDNDRLNVFHYAVFGRVRPNGSSGRGEIWGNDFMVTFATFGNWAQPVAQVGTFIHEFGHNLALTHGDLLNTPAQWNETFKPNFPTTMSYRYQFPGVSIDCDFISEGGHTFSQGMMARIVETNVNENIGICDNTPLDMNGDGAITIGQMDVSQDGDNTDTHDDFDQWSNVFLDFDAPGSGWGSN
jgi:hypothetical protein